MAPKNSNLDLAEGNPEFLFAYWKRAPLPNPKLPMDYQRGHMSDLEWQIRALHVKANNAEIDDKYLVTGNGARQLVTAILACRKQDCYTRGTYFSKMPDIALASGQRFLNSHQVGAMELITSPTNPEGTQAPVPKDTSNILLDAVYNWPIYTNPQTYDADIMVFGAAKVLGCASSRIGWAFFKDYQLAHQVQNFIEVTTDVPSIEAQSRVAEMIDHTLSSSYTIFDEGRSILQSRWKLISNHTFPFEVLNSSGMFMLCKGRCPQTLGSMPGEAFGMDEDHFRLNMGCSQEKFELFLKYYGKPKE